MFSVSAVEGFGNQPEPAMSLAAVVLELECKASPECLPITGADDVSKWRCLFSCVNEFDCRYYFGTGGSRCIFEDTREDVIAAIEKGRGDACFQRTCSEKNCVPAVEDAPEKNCVPAAEDAGYFAAYDVPAAPGDCRLQFTFADGGENPFIPVSGTGADWHNSWAYKVKMNTVYGGGDNWDGTDMANNPTHVRWSCECKDKNVVFCAPPTRTASFQPTRHQQDVDTQLAMPCADRSLGRRRFCL